MQTPKRIDPDQSYTDLVDAGALWVFETARYAVALFAEDEDLDPADSCFSDERDIEYARSGDPAHWFMAVVAVYGPDGARIGLDTLGGCSYGSFREFYSAHRDPNPANRNCSVQRFYDRKDAHRLKQPRPTQYAVCHYFPDMVRQAISDARTTLGVQRDGDVRAA